MKLKSLLVAGLAGMMLFAAGCGNNAPADKGGQDLKGKKLTMYVSFHEDTAKSLAEAFKKKTGAEVNFIRIPTGEAMARMVAEKDSPKADIWVGGTADAHEKMKSQGILEAYQSPADKDIPEMYRDKDGFWHGLYLEVLSIGYNKDRFEKEFASKGLKPPTTLEDLLNPAYKGEIITPDPQKSGTGLTFFASIIQKQGQAGWDYLGKFKEQVAQFTPSGYTPAQKTSAGEYLITVNFLSDQQVASRKGQKIEGNVYTDAGWAIVPIAKIKGGANNDVAKAFIDYTLSKEAGELIVKTTNGISTNPAVPAPEGQKPLSELNLFKEYSFIEASKMKEEIVNKFFK